MQQATRFDDDEVLRDASGLPSGPGAMSTTDGGRVLAPEHAGAIGAKSSRARGALCHSERVEGSDCATCCGSRLLVLVLCDDCAQMAAAGTRPTRGCEACVVVDCTACRPVPVGERGE
ncbi:MAG TPA: hypothetical protein VN716_19045 [Vicinamibacterales bacterium]|nr:hypothetical protein [Vicinamibacterales bacterium]